MKQLTLVRHAKSSWKDPMLDDRERPLNKRGARDAPIVGDWLLKRGHRPDLIVSSPALRALETAGIIARKLGYRRKKIIVEDRIYEASVADLLDVVRNLDESATRVMLFGHNPALTELANCLGPRQIDNLPTCGVVQFEFDTDGWTQVGEVAVEERLFEYPER